MISCVSVCVVLFLFFEYFGQSFWCLELYFSALKQKQKRLELVTVRVSSKGVEPFQEPTDYLFPITAV